MSPRAWGRLQAPALPSLIPTQKSLSSASCVHKGWHRSVMGDPGCFDLDAEESLFYVRVALASTHPIYKWGFCILSLYLPWEPWFPTFLHSAPTPSTQNLEGSTGVKPYVPFPPPPPHQYWVRSQRTTSCHLPDQKFRVALFPSQLNPNFLAQLSVFFITNLISEFSLTYARHTPTQMELAPNKHRLTHLYILPLSLSPLPHLPTFAEVLILHIPA